MMKCVIETIPCLHITSSITILIECMLNKSVRLSLKGNKHVYCQDLEALEPSSYV